MSTQQELDFSVDLMQALLWRHNKAKNLTAILQAKQNWYNVNQTQFWQNWFTNVFNLNTANQFGCIVWAIILGLPLNIATTAPSTIKPFGFGIYNQNFGNGNFSPTTSNPVFLSVAEMRQVLKLRYYQLTSRANTFQTNQALAAVFGYTGAVPNIYLIDNLNMTVTCIIAPAISVQLQAVLSEFDLIPRASCVMLLMKVTVAISTTTPKPKASLIATG